MGCGCRIVQQHRLCGCMDYCSRWSTKCGAMRDQNGLAIHCEGAEIQTRRPKEYCWRPLCILKIFTDRNMTWKCRKCHGDNNTHWLCSNSKCKGTVNVRCKPGTLPFTIPDAVPGNTQAIPPAQGGIPPAQRSIQSAERGIMPAQGAVRSAAQALQARPAPQNLQARPPPPGTGAAAAAPSNS
jgi:hypothetical protein